jgi:hypothetical protein
VSQPCPGVVVSPVVHTRGVRKQAHDTRSMQLRLLPGGDARNEWVLDERTRNLGRQGVAQAREILRHAQPPEPQRKAS